MSKVALSGSTVYKRLVQDADTVNLNTALTGKKCSPSQKITTTASNTVVGVVQTDRAIIIGGII